MSGISGRRFWWVIIVACALVASMGGVAPQNSDRPAADKAGKAETIITVTTTADESNGADGLLSLREAMDQAIGDTTVGLNQTIVFSNTLSGGTIALTGQLPAIFGSTNPITIDGGGVITIDGTNLPVRTNPDPTLGAPCINVVAPNNTIRGLTFINSTGAAIYLSGLDASNNLIEGCVFGTDAANDPGLGNYVGIIVGSGAHDNTIGGNTTAARNVISGNVYCGIYIESAFMLAGTETARNKILGNYIGTNITGDAAGPCNAGPTTPSYGVYLIDGALDNVIGGVDASTRNIISGNCGAGVYISSLVSGTVVSGNYIGTDASGTFAVPNTLDGVLMDNGAAQNMIGGNTTGERNVISGNQRHGISLSGAGTAQNMIYGNYIGTGADGILAMGNGADGGRAGVGIAAGASNNNVGNIGGVLGNVIANNAGPGVRVVSITSIGNRINQNSIHGNAGKGISLESGANNGIAAPVITGVNPIAGTAAAANMRIEFFKDASDEGGQFLGFATSDAAGAFTFASALTGANNVTATATDSVNDTSAFSAPFPIGGVACGSLATCTAQCPGASLPDADHDGLSACIETCMCTSDIKVDSDGDGMPDPWEAQYGLDPTKDDAAEDLDKDGISNLNEFFGGSDPADPHSPAVGGIFYVGPSGTNTVNAGTFANPWLTIGYAMSRVHTLPVDDVRVVLLPGDYTEDVTMESHVTLAGSQGGVARIIGRVTGNNSGGLENLTMQAGPSTNVLLDMNNVVMRLSNVVFHGAGTRTETGVLVSGSSPAESVIEKCSFSSLSVGIDIQNAIPKIRLNTFDDLSESAIILCAAASTPTGSLGEVGNAGVGCNTFALTIDGPAVVNNCGVLIKMELNDWGTNDAAVIAGRIDGLTDYEPFLASGGGLLAGSLYCTVWDEDTQDRILTASVQAGSNGPVTGNVDGIYVFPALPEGSYVTNVTAPNYQAASVTLQVGSGAPTSAVFTLNNTRTPSGTCTCTQTAKTLPDASQLFLGALSVVILLTAGRTWRMR